MRIVIICIDVGFTAIATATTIGIATKTSIGTCRSATETIVADFGMGTGH